MPIQIGPKLCNNPTCSRYQPCPDHGAKPFESSTRRVHTQSGWQQQREAQYVLYRDDTICHVCKRPGATIVDHIIPVNEGGTDDVSNKAPIHQEPCHRLKTADEAARGRARQQGE
jgi:5-methylcytosine-specific restriction endonuclease McrA